MMRKLFILGSSFLAMGLVFIANTSASTFKWLILYEPDIPESLR